MDTNKNYSYPISDLLTTRILSKFSYHTILPGFNILIINWIKQILYNKLDISKLTTINFKQIDIIQSYLLHYIPYILPKISDTYNLINTNNMMFKINDIYFEVISNHSIFTRETSCFICKILISKPTSNCSIEFDDETCFPLKEGNLIIFSNKIQYRIHYNPKPIGQQSPIGPPNGPDAPIFLTYLIDCFSPYDNICKISDTVWPEEVTNQYKDCTDI
jgi:hypothetical protein